MSRRWPTSSLCSHRWNLTRLGYPELSPIRVASGPRHAQLAQLDTAWPPKRRATDKNRGWSWLHIAKSAKEGFVVLDREDKILGIWCCRKSSETFESRTSYYLGHWEVDPAHRGGTLGAFIFALIACRALEVPTDRMVFQAFRELASFYSQTGGTPRLVDGLAVEEGLQSWVIERPSLALLKEQADAFLETTGASG